MVINTFEFCGIVGLVLIIFGNFKISSSVEDRKAYTYPLFILGGVLLMIYSIYLRNFIFIILQLVFIIVSIYNLNKLLRK